MKSSSRAISLCRKFGFKTLLASSIVVAFESRAKADLFYSVRVPNNSSTPFQLVTYNSNNLTSAVSTNGSLNCTGCDSGTPSTINNVNGVSFDPAKGNVFFFNSNTSGPSLFYATVNSSDPTLPTWGTVSTNVSALNGKSLSAAAYYNGSIFAINNASSELFKIDISYSGGSPSIGNVSTVSGFTTGNQTYGDIAIDRDGFLYGLTSNSVFYKYNLITNNFAVSPTATGNNLSLQLGFDQTGNLMGARSNGSGEFYSVDKTTGVATLAYTIAPLSASSSYSPLITDLASTPTQVPGPLPILGAAAAFSASRKLRSRVRQTKESTAII